MQLFIYIYIYLYECIDLFLIYNAIIYNAIIYNAIIYICMYKNNKQLIFAFSLSVYVYTLCIC